MFGIVKSIVGFFLDFIELVVISLAIFVVMYIFFFQPHEVNGKSMYDNFDNGDYLLTDKITYRFREPQRGEVVVFKAPRNEDYDYIKRVLGLPHDRVKIQNGHVFVNNIQVDESSYLDSSVYTNAGKLWREGLELTVPPGEYFVLGDNRNHSSDSRDWGTVPLGNIVGKAWFRYWPVSSFGPIPVTKYPKVGKTSDQALFLQSTSLAVLLN